MQQSTSATAFLGAGAQAAAQQETNDPPPSPETIDPTAVESAGERQAREMREGEAIGEAFEQVQGEQVAQALEATFLPGKPEEFHLPPLRDDDKAFTAEDLLAARTAQGLLAEALLPKNIGSYIAKEIDATVVKFMAANDAGREEMRREVVSQLEKLWGADKDRRVRAMSDWLDDYNEAQWDRGSGRDLVELLQKSGAFASLNAIVQMSNHVERLNAKKGGR